MKKILFALCALVLGLSAHAQTKGNIVVGGELELSTTGTKVSYTNNGTTNSGVANNGATGNNADRTSFQQMISNARVHDTDGILTDGENSHS